MNADCKNGIANRKNRDLGLLLFPFFFSAFCSLPSNSVAVIQPELFPVVISTYGVVSTADPTLQVSPNNESTNDLSGMSVVPPVLASSTVFTPQVVPVPVTVMASSPTISLSSGTVSIAISTPAVSVIVFSAALAITVSTQTASASIAVSTNAVVLSTASTKTEAVAVSTAVETPAVVATSPPPSTPQTQAVVPPSLINMQGGSFKPLSLDLREMDIVDVLKMLARQNGINMVIARNVSGKVTAFLNNVEFWKAFQTILSTRDLAFTKEGDLIEVMTSSDYERTYGVPFAKKTEQQIIPFRNTKAKSAKDALDPLRSKVGTITVDEETNSLIIEDTPIHMAQMRERIATLDLAQDYRIFRLNYASAEDLFPKISPLVSKEYGNLQIDKRSNTIAVQDNPARIKEISDMIQAFDVRHKAVLIEAKIVQITLSKSFQWGINWQGVNWTYIFNKLNGYHVAGQVVENLLLVPPASVAPGNVTAPGITATVGVLEKPNFQAVINFLDTLGTTNLLSSPRIMALNNQEAKINVGSKVAKITNTLINAGSTTSAAITTENVEFLDVGVKLSVTPTIGDDNIITMKVKPEVSSVEKTITLPDGSSIPVIRIAEAEGSLVVKDGITVVLGGLMEDNRSNTTSGVPFLSRIPLIGYLFRSQSKDQEKTELVIFLTPHIVNGEVVSPEAQERYNLQPNGEPKPKRGFFRRLFGMK